MHARCGWTEEAQGALPDKLAAQGSWWGIIVCSVQPMSAESVNRSTFNRGIASSQIAGIGPRNDTQCAAPARKSGPHPKLNRKRQVAQRASMQNGPAFCQCSNSPGRAIVIPRPVL